MSRSALRAFLPLIGFGGGSVDSANSGAGGVTRIACPDLMSPSTSSVGMLTTQPGRTSRRPERSSAIENVLSTISSSCIPA
ncbi:MAG: hypothetical protein ACK55I_43785, partial [bacterium]